MPAPSSSTRIRRRESSYELERNNNNGQSQRRPADKRPRDSARTGGGSRQPRRVAQEVPADCLFWDWTYGAERVEDALRKSITNWRELMRDSGRFRRGIIREARIANMAPIGVERMVGNWWSTEDVVGGGGGQFRRRSFEIESIELVEMLNGGEAFAPKRVLFDADFDDGGESSDKHTLWTPLSVNFRPPSVAVGSALPCRIDSDAVLCSERRRFTLCGGAQRIRFTIGLQFEEANLSGAVIKSIALQDVVEGGERRSLDFKYRRHLLRLNVVVGALECNSDAEVVPVASSTPLVKFLYAEDNRTWNEPAELFDLPAASGSGCFICEVLNDRVFGSSTHELRRFERVEPLLQHLVDAHSATFYFDVAPGVDGKPTRVFFALRSLQELNAKRRELMESREIDVPYALACEGAQPNPASGRITTLLDTRIIRQWLRPVIKPPRTYYHASDLRPINPSYELPSLLGRKNFR